MSKYHEEHLTKVYNSATYGVVSSPPRRGYVVMATTKGDDTFSVDTFDIVGIVIRSMPREKGSGASCAIVPLYIDPCYAREVSGGLCILEHDDISNYYYAVVWCDWPERDDHSHLESVRSHVAREAELEIERRGKKS